MESHEKAESQVPQELAQNGLLEREQRAAIILQAAHLGIHECDAEGRITFVNPSQERITGYTAEELLGTYVWDRHAPGPEKEALSAYLKRLVVEQPPPTPYLAKNIRKGGEVYDTRVDWDYKRDAEGRVTGFVSVISDVTEERRAYEELERRVKDRTAALLQANEQLTVFRRFAEASGQGFGMADLEGRLTYVNPALCRMFGEQKPEDAIGKHVSAYYRPQYVARRQTEVLPALYREGNWRGEEILCSRTGEEVFILQDTFLIRDEQGNAFRLASAITDITERKAAEDALRQSRDELQTIYDGTVDGVLVADVQSKRFLRANLAASRMLGYSVEELASMSVMDIHPQAEMPLVMEHFQALVGGSMSVSESIPVLRKDGNILYVDVRGTAIQYGGRPCAIGFFRDITERRQAEQALKEHAATLEAYAAALRRANERLRKEEQHLVNLMELQDRDRQLIGFEIHDELAQLLTGALMSLDAFRQANQQSPVQAWGNFDAGFELLAKSIDAARRLINGLRPPSLDVGGVVDAIADLIREVATREQIQIEWTEAVDFDRLPRQLENTIFRIVQESLMNACRHSKSEKVRIELRQERKRLMIEVRDWGIGFDPQAVSAGRFGLESIRERARAFGGRATIDSRPGEGTQVFVELPLPEGGRAADPTA